jgi:glycosyltransferase involved in cell wall biosynthesis
MAERSDLVVFIPAWNEEENLPDVLDELHELLPAADVLVIDDGSTDGTAEVARRGGADVISFSENRGLGEGIAAGYRTAMERGYAICGRVDADGQHPVGELLRLIDVVRSGRCDVAIGSRYTPGDGYEPYRYPIAGPRRFGTAVMRRAMRPFLGRHVRDPMSGMYVVNARAMPVLAVPFDGEAPEVEALLRLERSNLTVEELPVSMRERATGESKLRGKKAVAVVVGVGATKWVGKRLLFRRR